MQKENNESKGKDYWDSVIEEKGLRTTYDIVKYFEDKLELNFLELISARKRCLIFLTSGKKIKRKFVVKYFFDDNDAEAEWEKFCSVYILSSWNRMRRYTSYESYGPFFYQPAAMVSVRCLVLDKYIAFTKMKLDKNEKEFIGCRFFHNKISLEKEMLIRFFVYQIITVLKAAYDMRIVYTDLKPGNIFFNYSGLIKIGDMGGISDFTFLPLKFSNELEVTPSYSMLVKKENKVIDAATARGESIFSLGVTTYEFCSLGDNFFEVKGVRNCSFEEKLKAVKNKLEKIKHAENITIDFKAFLINMLDPELYKKTTFEQLLEHPWIQGPDGCYLKFVKDELLRVSGVSASACEKNLGVLVIKESSDSYSRQMVSELLVKDFFGYVLKIEKNEENIFNGNVDKLDSLNKNWDKILDEVKSLYELEEKLKKENKTLDKEKLKERNMKVDAISKKIDRKELASIVNRYIENLKKICWDTDLELEKMVIDKIRERVAQRFENYSRIFKFVRTDLSCSEYTKYAKMVASDLKNLIVVDDLSRKPRRKKYYDYFNRLIDDEKLVVADKNDLCKFADDVVSFLENYYDMLNLNTYRWKLTMMIDSDGLEKLWLENKKIRTYADNVVSNVILKQEDVDVDVRNENKKSITGLILNYFKERQKDSLSNSLSLETKSDIKVKIEDSKDDKIAKFKDLFVKESQKESYKIKINRSKTQSIKKTYIPDLINDKYKNRSLKYNTSIK